MDVKTTGSTPPTLPRGSLGGNWNRGGGVRAEWQECHKTPARLHRTAATTRGSGGSLLRDVACADGARAELVRHLAADIGEGLLDRRHGRTEHRLAVLARPD